MASGETFLATQIRPENVAADRKQNPCVAAADDPTPGPLSLDASDAVSLRVQKMPAKNPLSMLIDRPQTLGVTTNFQDTVEIREIVRQILLKLTMNPQSKSVILPLETRSRTNAGSLTLDKPVSPCGDVCHALSCSTT